MNNVAYLRSLFFATFITVSLTSIGQTGAEDGSKYGHGEDSVRCLRNSSLYREYARQKDFVMALPYWKITFNECPKASKNIYLDGVKIFKYKLGKNENPDHKSVLLDSLMLIYDQRIKYFGEKVFNSIIYRNVR